MPMELQGNYKLSQKISAIYTRTPFYRICKYIIKNFFAWCGRYVTTEIAACDDYNPSLVSVFRNSLGKLLGGSHCLPPAWWQFLVSLRFWCPFYEELPVFRQHKQTVQVYREKALWQVPLDSNSRSSGLSKHISVQAELVFGVNLKQQALFWDCYWYHNGGVGVREGGGRGCS